MSRDEGSRLVSGPKNKQYLAEMFEFLSQLWDGWIEGAYTRSYQSEGNIPVYVVGLIASSEHFYDYLDRDFFTQGLGNRLLWIVEEGYKPKMLSRDFFLSNGDSEDEDLSKLIGEIVDKLLSLETCTEAIIDDVPSDLWREYQYKLAEDYYKGTKGLSDLYKAKVALNALKFSMCYAGSRMSIGRNNNGSYIKVREDDMKRAIEDSTSHMTMYFSAMEEWQKHKSDYATKGHTTDFERVHYLISKFGGSITPSQLQQSTRWNSRESQEIISSMISAEEIEAFEAKTAGKPHIEYREKGVKNN